jgi:hypothetical protein
VSDRYARQRSLAAVGDLGQERIAGATYVVSSDDERSAEVEREYLARAGALHFVAAGAAVATSGESARFIHAAQFHDPAARAFAAGAWRALDQLRSAIQRG